MLQRSDEGDAAATTADESTKLLACVEKCGEDTECAAACILGDQEDNSEENNTDEDEVVKSGSLAVSSSAADDRKVVVASGSNAVSDLDTLTFNTSEEVTLTKVVLEKYGYSKASDLIANVWLEDEDGKEVSGKVDQTIKDWLT